MTIRHFLHNIFFTFPLEGHQDSQKVFCSASYRILTWFKVIGFRSIQHLQRIVSRLSDMQSFRMTL